MLRGSTSGDVDASRAQAGQIVVASTSLTGAIAHAAGAQEVRVLTPADASHPPEYDLKPADLLKLEGAGVVVYAGYERMVSRLVETSRNKQIVAIQVDTTSHPRISLHRYKSCGRPEDGERGRLVGEKLSPNAQVTQRQAGSGRWKACRGALARQALRRVGRSLGSSGDPSGGIDAQGHSRFNC